MSIDPRHVIGSNLRPGSTPGGFTKHFGPGKKNSRRSHHKPSVETIKHAAEATLIRHGVMPHSTDFDCTAKRRAFTLIEYMIVIVIVGLLAAMALPAFRMVKENRQHREEKQQQVDPDPDFQLYLAWRKLESGLITSGARVTFKEWKMLRDAGLLPQQRRPE